MKKIGIVGGTAWLSTVAYYSTICRLSERFHYDQGVRGELPTPDITIESLNLQKAVAFIARDGDEKSWQRFDAYHRDALRRLELSGVDFAIIASNTPHHRLLASSTSLQNNVPDWASSNC